MQPKLRLSPHVTTAAAFGSIFIVAAAAALNLDPTFHSPVFTRSAPVTRVLVLPDDSFFTFGNFSRLDGENLGAVLKFNPDGTRNSNFRFDYPCQFVNAVAVSGDAIFVAAAEMGKDYHQHYRILKLHPDGARDTNFNEGDVIDGAVRALAVLPDGKILVGGGWDKFNGEDREYLVRLNPNGTVDESFANVTMDDGGLFGGATGIYSDILFQADGKIVVGGAFTTVGNIQTRCVTRLNNDGTVDPSFVASFQWFSNSAPTRVRGLEIAGDGSILLAGNFRAPSMGSSDHCPVVRLDVHGGAIQYFISPNSTFSFPEARALRILPNGDIVAAGWKLYYFHPDGTQIFDPQEGPSFYTEIGAVVAFAVKIGVQSSGTLVISGARYVDDPYWGELKLDGLARVTLTDYAAFTAPDEFGSFQSETVPDKVGIQPDGKILTRTSTVDGFFDNRVDGVGRNLVARLNSDGTVDSSFVPSTYRYFDFTGFLTHSDGKLLVWGDHEDDLYLPIVERLNADGSVDESFQRNHSYLNDAFGAPDGSYILSSDDAQAVVDNVSIWHVLADGSYDGNFSLGVNLPTAAVVRDGNGLITKVYAGANQPLLFQPDGKFLFRYLDSSGQYRIARLNSDGSRDTSFATGTVPVLYTSGYFQTFSDPPHPNVTRPVVSAGEQFIRKAALSSDNKIVLVGEFDHYNGTAAPAIVQLLPDGTIDPDFHPGNGAQWLTRPTGGFYIPEIDSVEIQPDGKILVAGNFEAYDGVPFPGIARLNTDGSPDTTFAPPLALRDFGSLAEFPSSRLDRGPAGEVLVTGNYAAPGQTTPKSILRLDLANDGPPTVRVTSVEKISTGVSLHGIGVPSRAHTLQASNDLSPNSWLQIGTTTADADGNLFVEDANASSFTHRYYRFTYP